MRIATAFSGGFGALEFALKYENIEHEVVFACEWMEPQRKSYLLNHGEPTSNFYKDIRDMDGTKYKGDIDFYHLSPPCQNYSGLGDRTGASGESGNLMFEAIKSIDEVQPKIFTIENVKGLLTSNNGKDWENILRDLKSLPGYTITYGVINAKDQGTPQNRERVFIVGFRGETNMMPFPRAMRLNKTLKDIIEDDIDENIYITRQSTIDSIKKIIAKGKGYARFVDKNTTHAKTLTYRMYLAYNADYVVDDKGVRPFTVKECARLQGDFRDMFKQGEELDSIAYTFIGNAIDISSMRNLLKSILSHRVIFSEPKSPSFTITENKDISLFDFIGATA